NGRKKRLSSPDLLRVASERGPQSSPDRRAAERPDQRQLSQYWHPFTSRRSGSLGAAGCAILRPSQACPKQARAARRRLPRIEAEAARGVLIAAFELFPEVPTVRGTVLASQPVDERHKQLADPMALEVDVDRDA